MDFLEYAIHLYPLGEFAFIIVQDGEVVATGTHEGIGELLEAVAKHGDSLRGAGLADKIVGKAVAMVAAYAGITEIYTPLGSEAAQKVCEQYGISFHPEQLVPLILNKRNDGPCPLERLTLPLTQPAEAVAALREFVAQKPAPATSVS